jgi:hypothetical protein
MAAAAEARVRGRGGRTWGGGRRWTGGSHGRERRGMSDDPNDIIHFIWVSKREGVI